MNLTRQVMHDLLWSYPAIHVATALRISSSSLAKSCERRGIPTPPRGYWQRLSSGYPMPPIPSLAPAEFELPLPWTSTPELELLLQRRARDSALSGVTNEGAAVAETPKLVAPEGPISMPADASQELKPLSPEPPDRKQEIAICVAPRDAAEMAALANEISACEHFCREVLHVAKRQPLSVGKVMEAWVYTVLRTCRERDPLAALVEHCTSIAQAGLPIPWDGPDHESQSRR